MTVANLRADVCILEPHRDLQGLRRFMLATRDAHGLYPAFGYAPLNDASRNIERLRADPCLSD